MDGWIAYKVICLTGRFVLKQPSTLDHV